MTGWGAECQIYIQSQNIRRKVFGDKHLHFAQSLNNLAGVYKEMGNHNKALELYTQALAIYEKTLGKVHSYYFTVLNNLAGLHRKMKNYDDAWQQLLTIVEITTEQDLNIRSFDQTWVDSLSNLEISNAHIEQLMYALLHIYNLTEEDLRIKKTQQKQLTIANWALSLLEKFQKNVFNDRDKLRILAQSDSWLQKSLEHLNPQKNSSKAFNISDQNKSVLLLQASQAEQANRLGELPDSLVWKDKKLLGIQSLLQAKLHENRSKEEKDSLRNELNHINQDIIDFMNMIAKEYPKYHKLRYQQINVKVEDIQMLLDDNTVLLEYVISDSLLHIFKVSKKNVEWIPYKLKKKDLNNRIKRFHSVLKNYDLLSKKEDRSYQKYTKLAYWFYQNTIEPVLKSKVDNPKEETKITDLIIVTDGELGHLPFETFLVEQASQSLTEYQKLHYLVNDYNISYNYSATLWKENKEAPKIRNNGQILGIAANYDTKLDSLIMDVRLPSDQWLREALLPLPAARKEVETLQEKYQGFFAFDTLASEKTVKKMARDFAILHFATHGILDAKRPILSSLAFTENNDRTESNFWQAHEISKMELNANLVVLSACETGYGKFEKGNGIASLARAFMYAGASALIVSLWQVNDYATSEIMKNLYANLANGLNKDEALRQAKLQYIKAAKGIMAHPAFWSPFIQMGNTQPVHIKTKGNTTPWVMGAFIALLVLAGGFVLSKRSKEVT